MTQPPRTRNLSACGLTLRNTSIARSTRTCPMPSMLMSTYAKYGSGWNLGLYTQSITIKSSRTLQYYYDASIRNGREYETPLRTINEGHMSAHYSSPWAVAYQYQFSTVPYEEKLSWKVKTRTFMF